MRTLRITLVRRIFICNIFFRQFILEKYISQMIWTLHILLNWKVCFVELKEVL